MIIGHVASLDVIRIFPPTFLSIKMHDRDMNNHGESSNTAGSLIAFLMLMGNIRAFPWMDSYPVIEQICNYNETHAFWLGRWIVTRNVMHRTARVLYILYSRAKCIWRNSKCIIPIQRKSYNNKYIAFRKLLSTRTEFWSLLSLASVPSKFEHNNAII